MLDDRVKQLMEEAFKGKICCICAKLAQRAKKGKFYCHGCYPKKQRRLIEDRVLKVHLK